MRRTPASSTTARPPRRRVSFARVLLVAFVAVAVGWSGTRAVSAIVARPTAPAPSVFAAYADATVTPSCPFETPAGPAQSTVILSFVVAAPDDVCTPTWGGYYTLDEASSALELDRRISQLRLTGGQARVSFGGARGTELASACTDPQALREAYQSVIDRYELTHIDLDLEGASLDDHAAATRRAEAIKGLQDDAEAAGRDLAVWLTLPVGPTGLTDAGHPLGESQAWAKVGITPMIGQSDVPTERFTLADAAVVNEFAREHGVGLVSIWSLNRDATCGPPLPSVLTVVQTMCSGVDQAGQRFANVLAADLGPVFDAPPTRATPSPSPSRTPTTVSPLDVVDDPETSPFPIWDPLGTYPGGTKIVWHRQVYQARFWTSGFARTR